MSTEDVIFVIDDDPSVRDSLRALLESAGYKIKDYASANAFLADRPPHSGCLISDVRMPEMDGLELQEEVSRRGIAIPVIIMTGQGDVPLAVRAMKAGALDFLEKPFDDEALLGSVKRALELGRQKQDQLAEARAAQDLLALLTPRERHVLDQLVAGRSNKVAAYELGISPRTIEIHRARIMDKMNARSLSDLVRTALAAARTASGPA
jgi:two-component system response regulator FixJ